jgi:hypothetical protein
MVTASHGGPYHSSGFPNCPRASATKLDISTKKMYFSAMSSQAYNSFHCASAVTLQHTVHSLLFRVCSCSFRTPNDVNAVSYGRLLRLTCSAHAIDCKAMPYQWRASISILYFHSNFSNERCVTGSSVVGASPRVGAFDTFTVALQIGGDRKETQYLVV